jgi:hypothetical protein
MKTFCAEQRRRFLHTNTDVCARERERKRILNKSKREEVLKEENLIESFNSPTSVLAAGLFSAVCTVRFFIAKKSLESARERERERNDVGSLNSLCKYLLAESRKSKQMRQRAERSQQVKNECRE